MPPPVNAFLSPVTQPHRRSSSQTFEFSHSNLQQRLFAASCIAATTVSCSAATALRGLYSTLSELFILDLSTLKEKRGCLPSSMVDQGKASILQFAPFQSAVDEGFWHRLSSLKLNKLGIDESPIPITGFYAPCSHHQVSNHLTLLAESLPPESSEQSFTPAISRGNRNRYPVPGILYNTNSLEGFQALDKQSLLKAEAKKIWEDILSGKVEKDSSLLLRFLVVSYADLKKWSFHYWFAFPALILDPPATVVDLKPAAQWFSAQEVEAVATACNDWRNMISTTDVPFFLVSIFSNSVVTIKHLAEFETCQMDSHKVLFGFYDSCHLPNNPGWPLRNLLWFICRRCGLRKVQFFSYRENRGFADLELSLNQETIRLCQMLLVGNLITEEKRLQGVLGLNLAFEAADLNLKLMRWRQVPSLNLNVLSSTRCLLLGAGTLGCQVARTLMEQMEAIQSQQCEGSNHKDPYGDMIKKPEHSGCVRTFGKGVTKTDLKNGGKSSSYIFPQEYLQSMQSQVVDQVLQANPELQKLLEANPGVKIVLPYVSGSGSNGHPQNIDSSEHISMGAYSDNQLVHVGESDGNEVENDDIDP